MVREKIFSELNTCESPEVLFDLAYDYYQGQGFKTLVYVVPAAAAGPYRLMERGMPSDWMQHYREQSLHLHDPIPGLTFRIGHPVRVSALLNALPSLTADERDFIDQLRTSELSDGLLIPTYGPLGRPGLVGLAGVAHPDLLDEADISLLAAVAQQVHTRMELFQLSQPEPGLSPREREIIGWLAKGKSVGDIATILGLKAPTVSTHLQRIYAKLQVNDRVSCVAKAMSRHYV